MAQEEVTKGETHLGPREADVILVQEGTRRVQKFFEKILKCRRKGAHLSSSVVAEARRSTGRRDNVRD